jgi:hypothetical protein
VKHDAKRTTAFNLINIMLLRDNDKIEQVNELDVVDVEYAPINREDLWTIHMIMELIAMSNGQLKTQIIYINISSLLP